MKDGTIIIIILGIIMGASIILGLVFIFPIDSNTQADHKSLFDEEHYEIELTGLKDSYLSGESYSFSYVLSGFGNSCGSLDVSFPTNESDENVSMMSRGLCTDATPQKFVWDVQTEKGTTFGHIKLDPGDYFVTVEFEKKAIFVSETKRFTINSPHYPQDTGHESDSDEIRITPPESISDLFPKTVTVSIPEGTGTPGCEKNNECFSPYEVTVPVGTTVVWSNDDSATHTVTSGISANVHTGAVTTSNSDDSAIPNVTNGINADGPNGLFDSSLLSPGKTFEYTFIDNGTFDYFCMLHPWMAGIISVV